MLSQFAWNKIVFFFTRIYFCHEDHGMEEISNKTVIFLEEHVDLSLFRAYGSRALMNLFLTNGN